MTQQSQGAAVRAALHGTALDMAPLSTLTQYPQHESVRAACSILADMGDLAAALQNDIDGIDNKIYQMTLEEDESRDEVAIELAETQYFAIVHVLDAITHMIIRSNENKGETV